jgi:hypothetical protein
MSRLPVVAGLTALYWCLGSPCAADDALPKIAVITTVYHHNSHADVIASRLFQGMNLDDREPYPKLQLASLYVDQFPKNDKSRELAKKYGFPIYDSIAKALTLGGDTLAVDGVLLIAEHGDYPESPTGSTMYPKRRMFGEIADVFRKSGRVVPVFSDKHFSDNWEDAKWIYDTSLELKIPLMAGSSLPGLWRYPPARVERGEKVKEIVAVSYHRLDTYGFHALEMAQVLAEQRGAGETGIAAVQCLSGDAVWQAGERGVYDRKLLDDALAALPRKLWGERKIEEVVPEPVLFAIEHRDGLKVNILTLNGAVGEWSVAWQYADGKKQATYFHTQEARPFAHFGHLLAGIEKMMHAGQPAWPAERTLLTTGALDALLRSRKDGGKRLETPWLAIQYTSDWQWQQPPAPPMDRPLDGM